MKVLWITHDPIREKINEDLSVSGFWKESLLKLLNENDKICIKYAYPGKNFSKLKSGNFTFQFPNRKRYKTLPKITLLDLKRIIDNFQPEVIHIHGTEKPYGLIKKHTNIPILISLQGFLSESYNAVLGSIPLNSWEKEKTLKEQIYKNDFLNLHKNWFFNSSYEKEIIRINKYFAGRTTFDKEVVKKNNSKASYFVANELLRNEFYIQKWDINNIDEHKVFISSFANPLKGFHVLIEAVYNLKKEFPDIKIVVPGKLTNRSVNKFLGNSYFRLINKMIKQYELENNIVFLGRLDGQQMCDEMLKSHIFALPSFVENSSNALGESQVLGVPCVVSNNCGGISSIITENENGLFFDKGNALKLTAQIRRIFLDNCLAIKLSKNSRNFGSNFHNKEKIKAQYEFIYNKLQQNESFIK
jgi:glycosyltransferase involved in cell wall biosynthesis